MEVDTSDTPLLLPLADASTLASDVASFGMFALLAALAALYRYAHVSFVAHTGIWRSEWVQADEKAGKRSGAQTDRAAVMGISLGLTSGVFRVSAVVLAGWIAARVLLPKGGPAWLFVLGLSVVLALAFALGDLLIKRFVSMSAADKPSAILRLVTVLANAVLLPISAPLSRLAVVRTAAAQIRTGEELVSDDEDIETGVNLSGEASDSWDSRAMLAFIFSWPAFKPGVVNSSMMLPD